MSRYPVSGFVSEYVSVVVWKYLIWLYGIIVTLVLSACANAVVVELPPESSRVITRVDVLTVPILKISAVSSPIFPTKIMSSAEKPSLGLSTVIDETPEAWLSCRYVYRAEFVKALLSACNIIVETLELVSTRSKFSPILTLYPLSFCDTGGIVICR